MRCLLNPGFFTIYAGRAGSIRLRVRVQPAYRLIRVQTFSLRTFGESSRPHTHRTRIARSSCSVKPTLISCVRDARHSAGRARLTPPPRAHALRSAEAPWGHYRAPTFLLADCWLDCACPSLPVPPLVFADLAARAVQQQRPGGGRRDGRGPRAKRPRGNAQRVCSSACMHIRADLQSSVFIPLNCHEALRAHPAYPLSIFAAALAALPVTILAAQTTHLTCLSRWHDEPTLECPPTMAHTCAHF